MNDRTKAQRVMEGQAVALAELEKRFDHLRRTTQNVIEQQSAQLQESTKRFGILRSSRDQAQAIMEAQADQIDRLQKQLLELKKLVSAAKAACRKKGRCFDVAKGPKPKRSPGEKVRREIARVPGNLRRLFRLTPAIDADKKLAPPSLKERYAKWIAQQIEAQRTESENWDVRPKISLLIPVFDTSQRFLEALFESIAGQSYGNWEACVIDGGSHSKETIATLKRWARNDSRIWIERLQKNLGVAENTNRALRLATGEVVALVDHDDTLA